MLRNLTKNERLKGLTVPKNEREVANNFWRNWIWAGQEKMAARRGPFEWGVLPRWCRLRLKRWRSSDGVQKVFVATCMHLICFINSQDQQHVHSRPCQRCSEDLWSKHSVQLDDDSMARCNWYVEVNEGVRRPWIMISCINHRPNVAASRKSQSATTISSCMSILIDLRFQPVVGLTSLRQATEVLKMIGSRIFGLSQCRDSFMSCNMIGNMLLQHHPEIEGSALGANWWLL